MNIKLNNFSLIIMVLGMAMAITTYVFAKQVRKCLTCVCKKASGTTHITDPICNFKSQLTTKNVEELPNNPETMCANSCKEQNQQYVRHLIWSE